MALFLGLSVNLDVVSAASPSLADRVIEHKLANGLTVLMVERHQTPVVSINITFSVGGINEQVGQTGIAHFYEHMAFKGTRTVGTKDYGKEKPILDELALVGTELEHRQRELAVKSGGGTADEQAAVASLQRRFTELQAQASTNTWSETNWHYSTNGTGASGSTRPPAKISLATRSACRPIGFHCGRPRFRQTQRMIR